MALTSEQITAQNFKDFYGQIRPYLNGSAHAGFTPVGTVISVMGNHAPLNYLICNGQIVNIADYPELANYFNQEFGSINKFGGDGTTTFGIPDLRGEFLRGTGTNGHTNQGNGSAVGTHQDSTEYAITGTSYEGNKDYLSIPHAQDTGAWSGYLNADKTRGSGTNGFIAMSGSNANVRAVFASPRPTNTSVLYCIAYKNIFVDEGCNYSTDERVVGTWINGKPIYQKTVKPNMPATIVDGTVSTIITPFSDLGIINPEIGWVIDGIVINKDVGAISTINYAWQNEGVNSLYFLSIQFHMHFGGLYIAVNRENEINDNVDVYVTVRYTKTTD